MWSSWAWRCPTGKQPPGPLPKKVGVTYPLGLDKTGAITVAYRVLSFPTTFVIDSQGNEAKRFGIANEGVLRIFLNGQLDGG